MRKGLAFKWIVLAMACLVSAGLHVSHIAWPEFGSVFSWLRRTALVAQMFFATLTLIRAHYWLATAEGSDVSPAIDEKGEAFGYFVLSALVCTALGVLETVVPSK